MHAHSLDMYAHSRKACVHTFLSSLVDFRYGFIFRHVVFYLTCMCNSIFIWIWVKMMQQLQVWIYIYIERERESEGFPLTGIFHPWAQWDLGQTWLKNYSRRAAAHALVA